MDDYFSIGKIVATHGLSGEVVLEHALGKTNLKGLETLFIEESKGTLLPYFIEHTKLKSDSEIFVKLEGVNTKENGRRLNQRMAWLLKDDFDKYAKTSSPISLIGYTMINENLELGVVIEVIEQPLQVLCKIMYQGNEALIPLHEQSLVKIDKKKKEVHVALPDGLLDIYASQ